MSNEGHNRPDLSVREIEVALSVRHGKTCEETGTALGLGFETVRSYMNRLRKKTGLRRKPELAVWAVEEEKWLIERLQQLKASAAERQEKNGHPKAKPAGRTKKRVQRRKKRRAVGRVQKTVQ